MFGVGMLLWIALAQVTPTLTPTTPPFVASPTPGNPVDAFDAVFARFEASDTTPLTGEPFTLSLVVALPEGAFIAEWPLIEATWGAFEIRQAGEIARVDGEMRQDFVAVLWRPEDVITPETFVGYSAGGADVRRVPVRELFFSVPTVVDPDDETLRAPLPPMLTPWPYPALVIAAGAVLSVGLVFWSKRPRAEPERPPTPSQMALGKLRAVSKRPSDIQFQVALAILRDLHAKVPNDALAGAITAGESIAYTGTPIDANDAATFYDLAVRAILEAGRE